MTAEEMRGADARAQRLGTPGHWLMEQAGAAVAAAARALLVTAERRRHARPLILCGPGNNGGDGLVAARHLAAPGHRLRGRAAGRRTGGPRHLTPSSTGSASTACDPVHRVATVARQRRGALPQRHRTCRARHRRAPGDRRARPAAGARPHRGRRGRARARAPRAGPRGGHAHLGRPHQRRALRSRHAGRRDRDLPSAQARAAQSSREACWPGASSWRPSASPSKPTAADGGRYHRMAGPARTVVLLLAALVVAVLAVDLLSAISSPALTDALAALPLVVAGRSWAAPSVVLGRALRR